MNLRYDILAPTGTSAIQSQAAGAGATLSPRDQYSENAKLLK